MVTFGDDIDELPYIGNWLPIAGYDGHYIISDTGLVQREARTVMRSNGRPQRIDRRLLLQVVIKSNYACVRLHHRLEFVHTLVLETVVKPRPAGYVGRHKNEDPLDNRATNLAWWSRKECLEHARAAGIWRKSHGEECSNVKLTASQVLAIRASSETSVFLADEFGVHRRTIRDIILRQTWRHI